MSSSKGCGWIIHRFGVRQWVVLAVAAGAAVLSVAVCDRPSAHLRAMRSEPVVAEPLLGVEEVARYEFDYGTALGEPSYPEVLVLYRAAPGVSVRDATGELIDLAVAGGWQPPQRGPGHLQAQKVLAGEDVSLAVYRYDKPDPETGAEIGVSLRLGAW